MVDGAAGWSVVAGASGAELSLVDGSPVGVAAGADALGCSVGTEVGAAGSELL